MVDLGKRILIFVFGLLWILPLAGIPKFIFGISWGTTFVQHMWYTIAKLAFLGVTILCFAMAIIAED